MWSWNIASERCSEPGMVSLVPGVATPSSSAAAAVSTFAVDPGS
jgi:hypothetical protein